MKNRFEKEPMFSKSDITLYVDKCMLSHMELLEVVGNQFQLLSQAENISVREFGDFLFKVNAILERSPMGQLIINEMQKGKS